MNVVRDYDLTCNSPPKDTIRYILEKDVKYLYYDETFSNKNRRLIVHISKNPIFANILKEYQHEDSNKTFFKVKLLFINGDVWEGYLPSLGIFPFNIHGYENLFDGRFNV